MKYAFDELKDPKNQEYPFAAFWQWLTADDPLGCALHFHSQIEFIYVVTGVMDLWINNQKHTIGPNTFVMIHPNEYHRIEHNAGICYYFAVRFEPSVLYTSKQSIEELKCIIPFCISPGNRQRIFKNAELNELMPHGNLRSDIESLVNEWEKKPLGFMFQMRNRITSIFVAIIRAWEKQSPNSANNVSSDLTYAINYAQNYILNNCTNVSEADLARECNISYSYFSRSFKKLMGMSFNQYVNHVRINEAQRLLVSSNISVTDVALSLGFSSSSHFIHTFKSVKGITPNQFKQQYFEK